MESEIVCERLIAVELSGDHLAATSSLCGGFDSKLIWRKKNQPLA
jgi:hypothetical protein